MKLRELLYVLSHNELRTLAMAQESPGTISAEALPHVVQNINDGLIALHGRFDMKTKDLLIETYKHITFYHLKSRFADSQRNTSPEDYLYIRDLDKEPFTDDLIKVMAVYTGTGKKLPLNDGNHPLSVYTPQPLILQVPEPRDGEYLSLLYKARHEPLNLYSIDLEEEVDVPEVLQVALRAFVAQKVFGTMGTAENQAIAMTHATTYEMACLQVEQQDLVNTSVVNSGVRFELNGWI